MGAEAGADRTFVDFVRAQTPSLYRTALLVTHNSLAAEELLQETLVRLYPQWHRVEAAESPVAYVRRSLINTFLSSQRKPASRDVAMWTLPDAADQSADADPLRAIADRDELWTLLGALPEKQRAALVLRYVHDWPDDDIARALGCRSVTVRSLVSRGLRTLRPTDDREPGLRAVGAIRGRDSITSSDGASTVRALTDTASTDTASTEQEAG